MTNCHKDSDIFPKTLNNNQHPLFYLILYPLIKYENGLTIVNPGSASSPREYPYKPSYVIMEIDRHEEVLFGINYYEW